MTQNQKTVQPASPLAMRTLGKAFLSVGHKRGIQSFVESGESLLDSADELDPPPTQAFEKSGNWIFETIFLASVGCVVTLLLGWLVGDYWAAAWAIGPIFLMMLALPWSKESDRRFQSKRDAFERLESWRKRRF